MEGEADTIAPDGGASQANETTTTTIRMKDPKQASSATIVAPQSPPTTTAQSVLLFYKFHPLSSKKQDVELYRAALETLCHQLELKGRILVGCNQHQSEGINGTLSGSLQATKAFVSAMTTTSTTAMTSDNDKSLLQEDKEEEMCETHQRALTDFWTACRVFYQQAGCEPLTMEAVDFKWSTATTTTIASQPLFPDLNIKIVQELIGTGGVLAPISLDEVQQGYLTPSEWHERMVELQQQQQQQQQQETNNNNNSDTVLIDCRNTKEWQIGHFVGATDPSTTTFHQFPTWVQQHQQTLAHKKVLMYCTGGIRCEKASAYIRKQVPTVQEVRHLQGGIHKYLDAYGDKEESLWKGKNFVFDGRGAATAASDTTIRTKNGAPNCTEKSEVATGESKHTIVGTCLYCTRPHDTFDPGCVCTVCREPTLVCPSCRETLREYHCQNHTHLRQCYFTELSSFSATELAEQLQDLRTIIQDISVGRKFKQKRKTLTKQCDKIRERLIALEEGGDGTTSGHSSEMKCRNCGEAGCTGRCWGFHGLKRKRIIDESSSKYQTTIKGNENAKPPKSNGQKKKNANNNGHLQEQKALERQKTIDELVQLQLSSPPSSGRNPNNGIRIPKECTRILHSRTKGKWCGRALLSVLQEEYAELGDTPKLIKILQLGLLRVNDVPVMTLFDAESLKLKNMDVISRILHWHEPPIIIPNERIDVQKVLLPAIARAEYGLDADASIYVCEKPSTVPVHPAGPFLANSLTIMVEAQEGLTPKSLMPCHRIDRVTSGLTLCCTDAKIVRLIQASIAEGSVHKQYLAKVHGKFPSESTAALAPHSTGLAKWTWMKESFGEILKVDAPIETVDPSNGIRKITAQGKAAQSLFRFIAYDKATDTSMIACSPITGRSHQLRVHLQWLGFPIVDDLQYDGKMNPSINLSAGVDEVTSRLQTQTKKAGETPTLHLSCISEEYVKAAADICACCADGPTAAFTPAHLLQGGHQICLHAYRYCIPFFSRGKSNKHSQGSDERVLLDKVDLKVEPPTWAFATDLLTDLPITLVKK